MFRSSKKWMVTAAAFCSVGSVFAQDPPVLPEPLPAPAPVEGVVVQAESPMSMTLSQLLSQVLAYTAQKTDGLFFRKRADGKRPFMIEVLADEKGSAFDLRARLRSERQTQFAPPTFPPGFGAVGTFQGAETQVQEFLVQAGWDGRQVTLGPDWNAGRAVGRNFQRSYRQQWSNGFSQHSSSSYSYRSEGPMVLSTPAPLAVRGYVLLFGDEVSSEKYVESTKRGPWEVVEAGAVHALAHGDLHYVWVRPVAVKK